jgi:hypothetical protein
MKSGKNGDVVGENSENERAWNHSNKEVEHGYRDTLKWQSTIKFASNTASTQTG